MFNSSSTSPMNSFADNFKAEANLKMAEGCCWPSFRMMPYYDAG